MRPVGVSVGVSVSDRRLRRAGVVSDPDRDRAAAGATGSSRSVSTTTGLLLATVCACGTVGRDDGLGERVCSAAGPWRDRGTVETCLGEALAVPTTSPPDAVGGLCVADAARACADDGACRVAERCRCGRCRVVRCGSSAECRAGESCVPALGRCARPCDPAAAEPCGPGFVCSLGGCVAACLSDGECAHGETCAAGSGRCVAAPCDVDGDCAAGRICEIQTVAADVLHPEAFAGAEGPELFAEVRRDGRAAIHRFAWETPRRIATTNDRPLLEPTAAWEGARVGAPAATVVGEETWLVYVGGDDEGIGLAIGDGGGAFVRVGSEAVLRPAESWEEGRVGAPALVPGDPPRMLYVGGEAAGIGSAEWAADAGRFVRLAAPQLAPRSVAVEDRWVELDRIADPAVVVAGDVWSGTTAPVVAYVFVAARGIVEVDGERPGGAPGEWSIGLLLLLPWGLDPGWEADPFGPVLAGRTGVGPAGYREERMPGVVRAADGWRMAYFEPSMDGPGGRLRVAVCP